MERIVYEWTWERVDTWLAKQFSLSRNFFQHIIKRWWIMVNQKLIKKSYKLEQGDQVQVDDFQRYVDQQALEETPNIFIPIIHEESDYLIINKPKWVLSHPRTIWELSEPSVVGFLYHRYKTLPSIWNFIRAWLLHRLDKGTDGLMIVAKTERGLVHFKQLFQQKSENQSREDKELAPLKKHYRATCHVTDQWQSFLENIKDILPYYIESLVVPKIPHCISKIGITKIVWFDYSADKKKINIDLEILTGRTHQIRYHLSQAWLPIVGDYLYGNEDNQEIQLTAYRLEYIDLNWEYKSFEI